MQDISADNWKPFSPDKPTEIEWWSERITPKYYTGKRNRTATGQNVHQHTLKIDMYVTKRVVNQETATLDIYTMFGTRVRLTAENRAQNPRFPHYANREEALAAMLLFHGTASTKAKSDE